MEHTKTDQKLSYWPACGQALCCRSADLCPRSPQRQRLWTRRLKSRCGRSTPTIAPGAPWSCGTWTCWARTEW